MNKTTVAIIGGGPGGYVAAIRLKQYGIDSILFEKERLGGVCLNKGCIPTKTMVKISEVYKESKDSSSIGIDIEGLSLDYQRVFNRKQEVVNKLVGGIEHLFKKQKIEVVNEEVVEISKSESLFTVTTADKSFSADYIILATGSIPKELPNLKADHTKILTSDDFLNLEKLPESMAVIGGGVIGCEFASILNHFDVKVDLIEFMPDLLPYEDIEISKKIQLAFKKRKIKLHLKTAVEHFSLNDSSVQLTLSNNKTLEVEKVLLSVGRKPSLEIDFKGLKIEKDKDTVKVDSTMQTTEYNVFAIGDLTGKLMLAHSASKQGLMVAEVIRDRIKGKSNYYPELNYFNIPRCTFTDPEVASVGLTEEQARKKFENINVGKFPFSANGKALGMGNTFGIVKTISVQDTDKMVGMHIIGPNATELIAQAALIIGCNLNIDKVKEVVFAHPTLSEAVMESVEDLEGLSIHSL